MVDIKASTKINKKGSIKKIIQRIVFNTERQRESIQDNLICSFNYTRMLTKKYISNLPADFGGRIQTNGRVNFGMHRTKSMKALIHWVQYFSVSKKILT